MVVNHHNNKLINLVTYFLNNTKKCGKTKLFKLLYFADFSCFKKTGKNITGLEYYTWPKGPAPVTLFEEMKNPDKEFHKYFSITKFDISDRLNIKPKHNLKFDNQHFTKLELEIIQNITFIYKNALAKDMVEITHLHNSPWDKTMKSKGKNKKIDYTLAFDNDISSLSLDEYKQRKEEDDAVDELLS